MSYHAWINVRHMHSLLRKVTVKRYFILFINESRNAGSTVLIRLFRQLLYSQRYHIRYHMKI